MDFLKQLPTTVKIAIPAVLVALVAILLFTVLRSPTMVEVTSTSDVDVLDASKQTLKAVPVKFETSRDIATGEYTLEVLPEDEIAAATALKGSGLETRSTLAKKIKCPNEPGFTGTSATQTRYDNCQAALNVQQMLLSAGALAANVIVTDVETGDLIGPGTEKNVFVQVFLRVSQKGSFPARSVANGIKTAVGSSIERIIIMDDELHTLFSGADGAGAARASSGSSSTGSLASASGSNCSSLSGFEDIAQKEHDVSKCYEEVIGAKLSKVLGGSDRFEITAQAEIETRQRTTVTNKSIAGVPTSKSSNSSSGGGSKQNASEEQLDPGSTTETSSLPAGSMRSLRLTAVLDSNEVTVTEEQAVKAILRTYLDPTRKDPAPVTTRVAFDAGSGTDNVSGQVNKLAAAARNKSSNDQVELSSDNRPVQGGTSKLLLAAMSVVVIGLVTAIIILWRRGVGMNAERARLQDEFRNEQRLLDNFAQQSPDDIARELESLLGAPSSQEPTFR